MPHCPGYGWVHLRYLSLRVRLVMAVMASLCFLLLLSASLSNSVSGDADIGGEQSPADVQVSVKDGGSDIKLNAVAEPLTTGGEKTDPLEDSVTPGTEESTEPPSTEEENSTGSPKSVVTTTTTDADDATTAASTEPPDNATTSTTPLVTGATELSSSPTTEHPTDTPTTENTPSTDDTPPTDDTPSTETPTTAEPITTETETTASTRATEVVEPTYPPGELERSISLSIFFILMLLGISTILVHLMIKFKLRFMPESISFLFIGFFVGLILFIINKINPDVELQYQERFDAAPFFLLLLPPIIFESGYSLHKGNFFKNIGSIIIFAVVGTAISAIIVGGGLFLLSKIGVVYELNFIQSFTFGALISAVDPVATLAIFHALDVNPTLSMLVFGESVLNDAVAIVLTKTIMEQATSTIDNPGLIFLNAVGKFLIMFCGSALLGIISGLASALFLKYVNFREISSLEFVMWFIFGFGPYFMAEGLRLSGIMAVLFSGIVMSHYTHFNLSPVTQVTVQQTMRTVSFMAETVVFLYIGMQVFTITTSFSIGLIIWSVILILIGRAANIYPLSFLVNRFRGVKISPRMQFVMWFSGLRGAIAYALALNLQESVGEFASAETIRVLDTATLIIVLFTIVCLGASTLPLLKFLSKGSAVDEVTLSKTEDQGAAVTYPEELEEEIPSHPPLSSRHQWFLYLDYKYFRPFFIRRFTKREVQRARVDMQRRTNEWYEGLREASSEEDDDEQIIVQLETSFSHHHSHKSPPPPFRKTGSGGGASNKSPPPPFRMGGGASNKSPPLGHDGSNSSSDRSPLLWPSVQVHSRSKSSNGSNSSNSELGSVRDRTSSRSPPSGDNVTLHASSS